MVKYIFKYKEVTNSIKLKAPVPQGKRRSAKERNFPIVIEGVQLSRVTLPKEKGHGKDVPTSTLNSIRNQLLLRNDQFADFISCSMTKSNYIEIMKEKFSDSFD